MNNKRLSLMDDLVLEVEALRKENAALKAVVASIRIAQQADITAIANTIEECFQVDGNELGLLQVKKLRQLPAV